MIPLLLTLLLAIDLPEQITVVITEKTVYAYGTGQVYKERTTVILKLMSKEEYEKEKGRPWDEADTREYTKKGMVTITRVLEHFTL